MVELRRDYFLNRWVIVAPRRKDRPVQTVPVRYVKNRTCFFCPGYESMTTRETGRIGTKKRWKMRWFPNKYSAVQKVGGPEVRKVDSIHIRGAAYGDHEIIVETPSDKKQLWDFAIADAFQLLKVYGNRIDELEKKKGIKYVSVFKNHGNEGGASLQHSHSQVISMNVLPPEIKDELTVYGGEDCKHCEVMKAEMKTSRKCFENKEAVAFAPYASRFNYELWIFPKRHVKRISELGRKEAVGVAKLFLRALKSLKKMNASYNCMVYYSPAAYNSHLRIEIAPRLSKWAGLEMGSGIIINSVSPEQAARFYRGSGGLSGST